MLRLSSGFRGPFRRVALDSAPTVWADRCCISAEREAAFAGPGKVWGVMRKAAKGGPLHPVDARSTSSSRRQCRSNQWQLRAKAEHPFRVVKRQFGQTKTRTVASPRAAPSSSPSSRLETCSWSDEGCRRENKSARKPAPGRDCGLEASKSAPLDHFPTRKRSGRHRGAAARIDETFVKCARRPHWRFQPGIGINR